MRKAVELRCVMTSVTPLMSRRRFDSGWERGKMWVVATVDEVWRVCHNSKKMSGARGWGHKTGIKLCIYHPINLHGVDFRFVNLIN